MPAWIAHLAINADDSSRTREFYSSVFGWAFTDWGPPGFSRVELPVASAAVSVAIQARRELVVGVRQTGPEVTIGVDRLDEATAAVMGAGGSIIMERSEIPGVGALVFAQDPSGNVIGIMEFAGATG